MNKNKCRLCLGDGVMTNIFHKKNDVMISTRIMSIVNIEIYPDDGLPTTVCRKCLVKLEKCHEFMCQCKDSDVKLRNTIVEQDVFTQDIEIDLDNDAYNDELCKFSPKSDTIKSLSNDERQPGSNDIQVTKESVESTVIKDKTFNDKKTEKQQCFTCGKVMSSRYRLKTHMRIHTGERPFSCPHCNKSFSLSQNLKVHLRIHTGDKPLSCTDCNATFAHSAGLAVHRRKHTGQTPYCCMLCPRTFRTIGHLQYHTRRHTGEKKFSCDTCNRAFITRSDLKQHLFSHSGDKPHVCCICGLRLSRASHLKRHIQFIHQGEKPFVCSQCPLKFSHKIVFEKHKKKHEAKVTEKTATFDS